MYSKVLVAGPRFGTSVAARMPCSPAAVPCRTAAVLTCQLLCGDALHAAHSFWSDAGPQPLRAPEGLGVDLILAVAAAAW